MSQVHDRWDARPWLERAGDSISQLLNVLLLNGMPDESISGRSYRNACLREKPLLRWRVMRQVADLVFFWQPNHCMLAYYEDLRRAGARATATVFERAELKRLHPDVYTQH